LYFITGGLGVALDRVRDIRHPFQPSPLFLNQRSDSKKVRLTKRNYEEEVKWQTILNKEVTD